jgi:prepilin-type N-terminal cleavage/methylation domain-containing protein
MTPSRGERRDGGFTLTELLTVFVVLSTLAGIAVPMIRRAVQRADAAYIVSDARNMETAVRTYFEDTGALPATTDFGEAPPELQPMIGSPLFVYKDCEYRILTGTGTVRLRVQYPSDSPIGLALQTYQSAGRVVWTATRTDFYLLN